MLSTRSKVDRTTMSLMRRFFHIMRIRVDIKLVERSSILTHILNKRYNPGKLKRIPFALPEPNRQLCRLAGV